MFYSELTNINIYMNKYKNWYDTITSRGKKHREPGLERHHIIPRSLGGTDDAENITFITTREHFVCHWLLIKIYSIGEEHWKMLNALRMMRAENSNQKRYSTKITSRVYAKLKQEYAKKAPWVNLDKPSYDLEFIYVNELGKGRLNPNLLNTRYKIQ